MSSSDYDRSSSKRSNDGYHDVSSAARKKSRKYRKHTTYNYDPLPRNRGTIRLLQLIPSNEPDGEVHCDLITPTADEQSVYPYEALSWCWGKAANDDYIRIQHKNGKTYTKDVSPSLVAALKALRHKDRIRRLWIDMVCIDQEK
jgi:hypothetical protein